MNQFRTPDPNAGAVQQALDIQHDTDPAHDHGIARRIPHLGHTLLFFSLAFILLVLFQTSLFAAAHVHTAEAFEEHPLLMLASMALTYVSTLAASWWIFPYLWGVRFLQGIQWNWLGARRRWFWLLPAGILVSACAQLAEHVVPTPPHTALENFFRTPIDAWMVTLFGVLIVPIVEEIAFRGFLLPALATAYDWLALERTPAGLQRWESSTMHSTPALVFGAVFSSFAFALLHGDQLSFSWGSLAILFCVSIVLSYARIRAHSVSASALLHAAYNLTIFAVAFVASDGYRHLDKLK
jgi:uncharacterized protein